jgi:hypothetical protein
MSPFVVSHPSADGGVHLLVTSCHRVVLSLNAAYGARGSNQDDCLDTKERRLHFVKGTINKGLEMTDVKAL